MSGRWRERERERERECERERHEEIEVTLKRAESCSRDLIPQSLHRVL